MRILLAGGGTGGHLYPLMALAESARAESAGEVAFVGDPAGLEATLLPRAGYEFTPLPVRPLPRKLGLGFAPALLASLRSVPITRATIRELRPDILITSGGYVSACALVAAHKERIPSMALELNAVPGRTVRWLAKRTTGIALQFEAAADHLPRGKCRVTGMPIRQEIMDADSAQARENLRLAPHQRCLIIFGGSRAAQRINEATCAALTRLLAAVPELAICHLTGDRDAPLAERARDALAAEAQARYRPQMYANAMGDYYAAADLVLCRAGGSSIAEITCVARPSLLIPYPYAADQHQQRNAECLAAHGAAAWILDAELDGERLANEASSLLAGPQRLQAMATAAAQWGRRDAGAAILQWARELAGAPNR